VERLGTAVSAVAAALACLLGLFAFAVWLDSSKPNSTAGVTVVEGNVARLPQGETFVVTRKGKPYKITYQNDQVKFVCTSALCPDHGPYQLCDLGCSVEADILTGLGGEFTLTLREDGAVNVKWPWGWTYRPYKS
jgi:hypothetical protein